MGKQPKPTPEELRFVYGLLAGGYDERGVLEEYCRLYENRELKFPFRTDKRFVRERMRELEAAREVLQDQLKAKVDPVIAKLREEHFRYMAEVANGVLTTTLWPLDCIWECPSKVDAPMMYSISPDASEAPFDREQLRDMLNENVDIARGAHLPDRKRWENAHPDLGDLVPPVKKPQFKVYSGHDFENLLSHLKAESPEISANGLDAVIEQNPYHVIDTLRVLSRRKVFKGKCPVCQDW